VVLFFLGFGDAGGGASESYTVSLQVFCMCPNWPHLLHHFLFLVSPSSTDFILLLLDLPTALLSCGGYSLNRRCNWGQCVLSAIGSIQPSYAALNLETE
jgi:hypothetical protein